MDIFDVRWENNLRRVARNYGYELNRRHGECCRKTEPGPYLIACRRTNSIAAGITPPLPDLESVAAWLRQEIPRIRRLPNVPPWDGGYFSATGRWTLPGGGFGPDCGDLC